MDFDTLKDLFNSNLGTLVFALFGALCLTVLTIKEHFDRPEIDKMPNGQYAFYCIGWLFGYPILGVGVALTYLANDNQFGAFMALQIGLTSPAIIVGISKGGANKLALEGVATKEGQ